MSIQEVTHRENGAKIRRARKLVPSPKDPGRHISHQDLAPQVGCTPRHLIRLEKGEQLPSGQLRDRIVEVTGTEERIESDDDDSEEDLLPKALLQRIAERMGPLEITAFDLFDEVTESHAQDYRRSALHSLHHAAYIEKELACRGS